MRGQAGDEHGGSPWFKGGVEPRRMARVVDAVGRRASSQSFPPRSGLVEDPLSPVLDGRAVGKSRLRALFSPRSLRSARLSRAPRRGQRIGFDFRLDPAFVRPKSLYANG